MSGVLFYDGVRFPTEKAFVEYYEERINHALECPEDARMVCDLIETYWDRLANYNASVYDLQWNSKNQLSCFNTYDSDRLTIGKGTLRKCYKKLRLEVLSPSEAAKLAKQMHVADMTRVARRLVTVAGRHACEFECERCGVRDLCDGDHVVPFEQLWQEFRSLRSISEYDRGWRAEWKEFHDKKAVIQNLCQFCHSDKTRQETSDRTARVREAKAEKRRRED